MASRYIIVLLVAGLLAGSARSQSVVINELSTATDWLEIANFGAASVDISGWLLYTWSNTSTVPQAFQFPGTPGSQTVVLAPDDIAVVSESTSIPVVPLTAQRFTTSPLNLYPFASNTPGSAVLTDASGSGYDYVAWGTPNPFGAPFELSTYLTLGNPSPLLTSWAGDGAPAFSGVGAPNNGDALYRHSRQDSNTAADWTCAATSLNRETPGALNPHQHETAQAVQPLIASAVYSGTAGFAPLTIDCTNVSIGDAEVTATTWDFDALANPGALISTAYHARVTLVPPTSRTYAATLTVVDALGGMNTTAPETLQVNVLVPPTPVTSVPFFERFEGPASSNFTRADPVNGWEVRNNSGGRVRTLDPRVLAGLPPGYTDAFPTSGPIVAILDSVLAPVTTPSPELMLHIDLTALGGAARIRFRVYDNADETNPNDVIVFQDGVTTGNGVTQTGASTGAPGAGGFVEILLNDWNNTMPARTWTVFEYTIDASFLAQHGLVASSNARLVFRQQDNSIYELGDGLLIDDVAVLPMPTAGPGQPCQPGAAVFDVNDGLNLNGDYVGNPNDLAGPFFATGEVGGLMRMTLEGEPNRPVVLLTGPLAPGIATFAGIGKVDLGVPSSVPPYVPNGIVALVDGTQQGFFDSFFNTTSTGRRSLAFTIPASLAGTILPLQLVVYNAATVIRLSNSVELTLQ